MKNIFLLPLFILALFFTSCESDKMESNAEDAVAVGSDLYNLLEKVASKDFETDITCIDFNYPFTLIVFNEENFILDYQLIENDEKFSRFLASLEIGKSISLSFPITSYLENGEPYLINNNEDLKAAIDSCVSIDQILYCNGLLTATDCIWKVEHLDGPNSQYNGSYFEPTPLGTMGFHYDNNTYAGTWTTYVVADSLRLNIYILDEGNIAETWNYDWKNTIIDENQMEIENGIDHFLLTKECEEPCRKFVFEECETTPGSGVANFDLPSYEECFLPFTGIVDPTLVTISYYETSEDSQEGTNPIANFPYQNIINPQIIYIRFEDSTTEEPIFFMSILIKAIPCL